ncbi:MAG TPA: response regulator transcription factor [Acidimicrobiales bacterium]|nr:response regulator transcription factor [Acidimicrobiales bacterium]
MVRVLIADDHTMVREGLRWALEHAGLDVVGEASDGEEAVEMAEALRPDVVLMDLSLPVLSGVAATKRIRNLVRGTSVLALSMLSDDTAVSSALGAGAAGYLVKDCTTTEIVDAVNRVARGERVLAPAVAGVAGAAYPETVSSARSAPPSTRPLISKREEEVLRLMATGVSIPDAASRLFISVKTVKNHLSSIYQKLDSHDRAQAVLKAMRMGLIRMD